MLEEVVAITEQGDSLGLLLHDISNGYLIKDIQGLTPVHASLVSSGFAMLDGELYQAASLDKRNIVIRLGLEPDYSGLTVSELRQKIYNIYRPKAPIELIFYMENNTSYRISGRVESVDGELFSKEPELVISVVCYKPNFLGDTNFSLATTTVTSAASTPFRVLYDGTVPTGFEYRVEVNRSIAGFTINLVSGSSVPRSLEFAMPLVNGDIVTINTERGNKSATLNRGGTISSVVHAITTQSTWLELETGENDFRTIVSGASMPARLVYTAKYGGL